MGALLGYIFFMLGILCLIVLILSTFEWFRGPRGQYDECLPPEYRNRGFGLSSGQIQSAYKYFWINYIVFALLYFFFMHFAKINLANTALGDFLHRIHFF